VRAEPGVGLLSLAPGEYDSAEAHLSLVGECGERARHLPELPHQF
jgi:hypothetical protein